MSRRLSGSLGNSRTSKCLRRSLFIPVCWIVIPYGSSIVSAKLASVTLAAASCFVLPLAGADEPVCVGVDVDAMLPVAEEVPVLFPLELTMRLRDDMTVSHSHVVYSGFLAKTWHSRCM